MRAPARRRDHILEIDGLRAIAVLLVLWIHLPNGIFGESLQALRQTLVAGNFGVDLFFVLSGFLITRILLVEREKGVPVRYFMTRRFLRIFPIYYLTIFALWPLMSRFQVASALTYTTNFAHLFTPYRSPMEHAWSLSVEEHFYLLWPPAVAYLRPIASRRLLLFGVLPVALTSLTWAVFFGPWKAEALAMEEFVLRSSPVRFLSLGVGACMAFHEGALRASRKSAGTVIAAALAAATAFWFLSKWTPPGASDPRALRLAAYVLLFPCVGCALLTFAISWSGSGSPASRLLRASPMRGIGRVSYALYLFHFPIFEQIGIFGALEEGPQPLRAAAVVAMCFALATLSYFTLERPLLRLGRRFRGPTKEAAGPRAAGSLGTQARRLALAAGFVVLLTVSLRGGAADFLGLLFSRE